MLNRNKYDAYTSNEYLTFIAKDKNGLNIRFSYLWDTVEFSFDKDFQKEMFIGTNLLRDILETRNDVVVKKIGRELNDKQ